VKIWEATVLVHPQEGEILVKFGATDVIDITRDTINCRLSRLSEFHQIFSFLRVDQMVFPNGFISEMLVNANLYITV